MAAPEMRHLVRRESEREGPTRDGRRVGVLSTSLAACRAAGAHGVGGAGLEPEAEPVEESAGACHRVAVARGARAATAARAGPRRCGVRVGGDQKYHYRLSIE